MTALQYSDFKTSVIGQPIRQNVKVGNVDDKGRLMLSGDWSRTIISWYDFCVVVAGVPTDIGLTLDGGQTIYLEATINRFDKYYFYNCDETLVLIYKRISK